MDATFHNMQRPLGGHTDLCGRLQTVGLGLVDASAQFRHPMRPGDAPEVRFYASEWTPKTMSLAYEGYIGDKLSFKGREVRCLFVQTEQGIVAGEISEPRGLVEAMNE